MGVVTVPLVATRVTTWGHVNCMRLIRNQGRAGFSNDNREVTEEEQWGWWRANHDKLHAWLYSQHGEVVGFGMIKQAEDGWHPSAGVWIKHIGRGLGGKIVDMLADEAKALGITLYAQAKLDNPAAVKTHHADRWDKTGEDDTYAYFRSKP